MVMVHPQTAGMDANFVLIGTAKKLEV